MGMECSERVAFWVAGLFIAGLFLYVVFFLTGCMTVTEHGVVLVGTNVHTFEAHGQTARGGLWRVGIIDSNQSQSWNATVAAWLAALKAWAAAAVAIGKEIVVNYLGVNL
jgi:hypothetical protein